MSEDDDLDYHRVREAQERHAAAEARCELSRGIHLILAERHADEAWAIEEKGTRSARYG